MKRILRAFALLLASVFALSALACGGNGGGNDKSDSKTTYAPQREAMMPPIKWQELKDETLIKVTVNGVSKTYTGEELWALDRGQIVGYDDATDLARDGVPMYFVGVYLKGLIYDAAGTIDFEDFETFKLVGVDGSETDLLEELEYCSWIESVLALQRGAVVTDKEAGCMLVLKSNSGKDQLNRIHKGIAEIVIG